MNEQLDYHLKDISWVRLESLRRRFHPIAVVAALALAPLTTACTTSAGDQPLNLPEEHGDSIVLSYSDDGESMLLGTDRGELFYRDGSRTENMDDVFARVDTATSTAQMDYPSHHDYNPVLNDVDVEALLAKSQGSEFPSVVLDGTPGNDSLIGTIDPDTLNGLDGNDTLWGGPAADNLNGGNGVDLASYGSSLVGVNVSLATGSGIGGDAEGDVLTGVESLRGSDFDDVLTGDAGNNTILGVLGNDTLNGGDGADTLLGGAGADVHNGGNGNDYVMYSTAPSGVTVSLSTGGAGGDAAGDTYNSIEHVRGSNFDDIILGNGASNTLNGATGNDTLSGGDGDDYLLGGPGADNVNGGNGSDWSSYASSPAGINIDLQAGTAGGGDATGDNLSGIEHLRGTNFNDTLLGNGTGNSLVGASGDDVLDGRGGNDTLVGGVGADTLTGGPGEDFIVYNGSTAPVTINLATQTVSGGEATGDVISGIENAKGSPLGDNIVGDDGPNVLSGEGGDDVLDGGDGLDTVAFSYSLDNWTIDIQATTATSDAGESDIILNFENVTGSQGDDNIFGTNGNNVISGSFGNDVMDGRGGTDEAKYSGRTEGWIIDLGAGVATAPSIGETDTLISFENASGSDANDTIIGTAGNNALHGGPGADLLNGGAGEDTAAYSESLTAVVADLVSGGSAGDAAGDSYISIENLRGSDFNDTLLGNAGSNVFVGGPGNDTINGRDGDDFLMGGVGADTLDGGNGGDYAVYSNATGPVVCNLSTGTGSGNDAQGDQYISIEHIRGGPFGDTLIGDAGSNTLVAAEGNDTLDGGPGNDSLLGGPGDDTFVFGAVFGFDVLSDFVAGVGTPDVLDVSALGYQNLGDVLADAFEVGIYTFIQPDGSNAILLRGVAIADLDASDFIFAP